MLMPSGFGFPQHCLSVAYILAAQETAAKDSIGPGVGSVK